MEEFLSVEFKKDLEDMYVKTRDLLDKMEATNFSFESGQTKNLMEDVKFYLESFEGLLQKDLYNRSYIVKKTATCESLRGDKALENKDKS